MGMYGNRKVQLVCRLNVRINLVKLVLVILFASAYAKVTLRKESFGIERQL